MIQFIIEALDGTDKKALDRRMTHRPAHLECMKRLRATDNYIFGGAKLDEAGTMVGSTVVLQFASEAEFQAYYAQEPYIVGKVWKKIKVYKFRVANIVV
jgi:uncharacterized protein